MAAAIETEDNRKAKRIKTAQEKEAETVPSASAPPPLLSSSSSASESASESAVVPLKRARHPDEEYALTADEAWEKIANDSSKAYIERHLPHVLNDFLAAVLSKLDGFASPVTVYAAMEKDHRIWELEHLVVRGFGGAVHMAAELGLRSLQKQVIDGEIYQEVLRRIVSIFLNPLVRAGKLMKEAEETGEEGLVPIPFPIAAVSTPNRSFLFPSWDVSTAPWMQQQRIEVDQKSVKTVSSKERSLAFDSNLVMSVFSPDSKCVRDERGMWLPGKLSIVSPKAANDVKRLEALAHLFAACMFSKAAWTPAELKDNDRKKQEEVRCVDVVLNADFKARVALRPEAAKMVLQAIRKELLLNYQSPKYNCFLRKIDFFKMDLSSRACPGIVCPISHYLWQRATGTQYHRPVEARRVFNQKLMLYMKLYAELSSQNTIDKQLVVALDNGSFAAELAQALHTLLENTDPSLPADKKRLFLDYWSALDIAKASLRISQQADLDNSPAGTKCVKPSTKSRSEFLNVLHASNRVAREEEDAMGMPLKYGASSKLSKEDLLAMQDDGEDEKTLT
jgi:hypothetical protein